MLHLVNHIYFLKKNADERPPPTPLFYSTSTFCAYIIYSYRRKTQSVHALQMNVVGLLPICYGT